MVCLSLPLDDKMLRVHEFQWWEVLSVLSSFCTVCGKPDLCGVGHQGQSLAPASSHTCHGSWHSSLISPESIAQLAPNFPLQISYPPLVPAQTYCALTVSTVQPIFHPVGSLSSTSQAESCGLTSTWKALFGLESPFLTCLPSLVWQGRSEFHRNETSWNVPEEPPGWKAPKHMQSSQVSLVALYGSRYQKKMLPISKAVTKMGPRKAQPLSLL